MTSYFTLYDWSYGIALLVVNIINWALSLLAAVFPPINGLIDFLKSSEVLQALAHLISGIVIIVVVGLVNLLVIIWLERKMAARLQDRYGPKHVGPSGFFQLVADGLKLFQKETITPKATDSWMYHAAPAILATTTLAAYVAIPFSEGFWVSNVEMGILLFLAAFSLAPLAVLVGGWASNNKYTLLGGLRAAAQMMSYEIPLVLTTIGPIILAQTLNPVEMVAAQQKPLIFGLESWFILPLLPAFLIFLVALVAELERLPFDLPEAEAELVEGWTTEYSSMRFGLIFMVKWIRTWAGAALVTILFLGGWSGPFFPQEVWFILKTYLVFFLLIWIAWSLPRVRIDQILNIGWRRMVPYSLILIFWAAYLKVMGWF